MAIENSVPNDFLSTFVDSIDVFDCPLCVDGHKDTNETFFPSSILEILLIHHFNI